jgi:hypothetical protein
MANHDDHDENNGRSIFPMLVSERERLLLNKLSTESGLSRSEVLRRLLLREFERPFWSANGLKGKK